VTNARHRDYGDAVARVCARVSRLPRTTVAGRLLPEDCNNSYKQRDETDNQDIVTIVTISRICGYCDDHHTLTVRRKGTERRDKRSTMSHPYGMVRP